LGPGLEMSSFSSLVKKAAHSALIILGYDERASVDKPPLICLLAYFSGIEDRDKGLMNRIGDW
jgi:hypothetical protein